MRYRDTIYRNYDTYLGPIRPNGQQFQDNWNKAYSYYLRGWLPLSRDAEIADLGCGKGNMLVYLENMGYRSYVGVDVSSSQLQGSRVAPARLLQKGVLQFLSERKNTFQLLLSFDLIEHFNKDEALLFLRLCYQSLVPGGRIVIQTPNGESPWAGSSYHSDITHEICFTPSSLIRLMKLTGFADCQARETGPVSWGYSLKSTARYFLWQLIRMALICWNMVETGFSGSRVFTRVFLVTGKKDG